jgi:hypothetical protein
METAIAVLPGFIWIHCLIKQCGNLRIYECI